MLHLPWFNWIEKFADPHKPATRVDTTESANGLIAGGGGIGVATCVYGDKLPGVVRVFPEPIHEIQSWFVYHESSRDSARIKVVLEMLMDYTGERKDLLRGCPSA